MLDLHVRYNGGTTRYSMGEDETVLQLKEKIQQTQGVSIQSQRLIGGGKFLEDAKTLRSYNIFSGFVVQLVPITPPTTKPTPNIQQNVGNLEIVFVRTSAKSGRRMVFKNVKLNTTIENFRKTVSDKEGTPVRFIKLMYMGKELEDVGKGNSKIVTHTKKGLPVPHLR